MQNHSFFIGALNSCTITDWDASMPIPGIFLAGRQFFYIQPWQFVRICCYFYFKTTWYSTFVLSSDPGPTKPFLQCGMFIKQTHWVFSGQDSCFHGFLIFMKTYSLPVCIFLQLKHALTTKFNSFNGDLHNTFICKL